MADIADLEIGLHRREAGSYSVEFRFSQPNSEVTVRIGQGQSAQAKFDIGALEKLGYDPAGYGEALTKSFFAEPTVLSAFGQVRASTQAMNNVLRLRLMIGPSAPELHALRWELLCDPEDNSPLSTSENVLFSRYLSSPDWRPVNLRARSQLHTLVVVSNPENLSDYDMAEVKVKEELDRARQGLGEITTSILAGKENGGYASLNNLVDCMRSVQPDIVYLVCHGAVFNEEPWLWLENEQGQAARTSGKDLVTRLRELEQRPRLIVLASCESAGSNSGDALAALGPRLAEAGIPAVLAMQGKASMQMVAEFMPQFFKELQRDGQIDRALAAARGSIRQRNDYWVPSLYMRLKSGRIWYVPGFGEEKDEFEKWQSLVSFIQDGTCTPILGPGLLEAILGPRREIAVRWAEKNDFPLSVHQKDNLPQVAQYLITHQSAAYLPMAFRDALRTVLLSRYKAILPEALQKAPVWSTVQLQQGLQLVADAFAATTSLNPYRVLAEMKLPIYITTDTTDFMEIALTKAGAQPVTRICPWNKWIPKEKAVFEDQPTAENPLVYHLYGHMSVPNSLVFSEDRFFDFLIGVTQNKTMIPSAIRAALSNSSLLFLGTQMDDWEFRVFFRFLMAQEGREMLKFFTHVAAQIEPEEELIVDVKGARKYLEEYFESENIAIYWGTSQEFLKGLQQYL